MLVLIVFPLVLAWMLVPASAKPGIGRSLGRDVAAAAPQSDAQRLAGLVNAERTRRHLPALKVLPRLTEVAGAQSARMAREHRVSASVGLARAIQPASAWAENVDCADDVEQAHQALMRSPTRRANILSRSFNALGIGAAPGGCLWVTELFARMPAGTATQTTRPGRSAAPTTTAPTSSTKASPKTTAAPTSAPAGGAATTVEKLTSDLFARLNAERRARGLAALDWDDDLARMAAGWSAQMARTGNFSHRDLGAASGLPGIAKFSALGENIAWVEGYANMGNQLHLGWMRSAGHRENMLQPGFDSVGIGVVCDGGRAWATQNFGRLDTSKAPPVNSATPAEEPIVATRLDGVRC